MNTANPENPELTILQKNILDSIEPITLLKHFKFSAYNYDDCVIDTFDRYILVACKDGDHNDILLLCDIAAKTVDVISYKVSAIAKNAGELFIGSPLTESVYQIFNGFDDMDLALENYWKSKGEKYGVEELKKTKWLRFMGSISPNQTVQVYVSYDDAGFSLIGTMVGSGSYVDASNPQAIGVNMVGEEQIGGGDLSQIYEYFMELKLKSPKFRKRTIKLVATEIGYFDFHFIEDDQVLLFNKKIPKRFRMKQNVSSDGLLTNLTPSEIIDMVKSPSANGHTFTDWTNPENAYASDDVYAIADYEKEHDYYNFNFNIPSGATITGIEVLIEAKVSITGTVRATLYNNSKAVAIGNKTTGDYSWGVEETKILGSPSDLWGGNWSSSNFSNDNFMIALFAKTFSSKHSFSVDHIQVKVYYKRNN